ncbi:right-handed parallel beta-helix repeat-containing protein [Aciduricibacillus chroicocephali]|uniref:Right-handed parallel beta-helix repeat-containing protein n=1 Tax=Aciduricibacillus chroicocephali TaxID=3054939 RepID=A0ABY9KUM5_9BACI|nr:right-handed parallel beta-helix repeat-containing protein [Bacillaceae bacterium 44XB]
MRKLFVLVMLGCMLISFIPELNGGTVSAKGKPTYKISPASITYKKRLMNVSTYNKHTKHYYLLRTYLERLEQTGGGTLVLKRGTYSISNALYVPSNVTIQLENGAKILKTMKTGTRVFGPAASLFHFVRPSRSHKRSAYGGYSGEKNIAFIGKGNATINMNFAKNGNVLLAGHNQNLKIEGIRFENINGGHFIEIDATKNSVIRNNIFIGSKPTTGLNKEAINIDTPDKSTQGFNVVWSKQDKMPNRDILIEGNRFEDLDRAVGTHKYSEGKLHDNVVIRGNTIDRMRSDAIRVMNWSNAVIEDNTIKNVNTGKANNRGILASGASNPTFRNNLFISVPRAMQFMVWKNSGPGSQYGIIYNSLTEQNIEDLKTNRIVDFKENFIRINTEYDKFDKSTTQIIPVLTEEVLLLNNG